MVCDVCGIDKESSKFPTRKDTTRCLSCRKRHYDSTNRLLFKEKRYAHNRHYQKVYYRFKIYGITKDYYDSLLLKQDFKCAICKDPLVKDIHIDHDHRCCSGGRSCGKCVRGLVCGACNKGLGMFKDSPNVLLAAAFYLDKHKTAATQAA